MSEEKRSIALDVLTIGVIISTAPFSLKSIIANGEVH